MDPEVFVQGLLDLWDELASLVGTDWPTVSQKLEDYLGRLEAASRGTERLSVIADMAILLRPYPAARSRMLMAVQAYRGYNDETRLGGQPIEGVRITTPLLDLLLSLRGKFPTPQQRYINVCIAREGGRACLPRSTSLGTARAYELRLNIGSWSPDSVVENRRGFPEEQLPPSTIGHWLDVVAVSEECSIPSRRYHLFLPRAGESWVCDCEPRGEHTCTPEKREPFVFIPLRTPRGPTTARVRIGVYYQNNLIQSLLLTARIVRSERIGAGHRSWVDYTLTTNFHDIGAFPPRTMNILTNDNHDGTHRVVVKDGSEHVVAFRLTEGQVREATNAVRNALYHIHVEDSEHWLLGKQSRNRYDMNNAKPRDAFVADLKQLAPLGQTLWSLLLEDRSPEIWQTLEQPATIQVSRTGGSTLVFPWSLVYDLALEPGAQLIECRLLREWDRATKAITSSARRCPYEGEHYLNTICPFGFWGFKHIIEQPPSSPEGRSLQSLVRAANQPLRTVVAHSLDLDAELTTTHLQRLAPVIDCASLADLRKQLALPVEIVYFYTHGRRQSVPGATQTITVLSLGSGQMLTPQHITAWRRKVWPSDHWRTTSPLVFINGCHTAEISPESLVNFVDTFNNAYSAGVIGTEITVAQRVANEAAEEFFGNFRTEQSVGEALHQMRINLLLKGNVLGLAYTPYCSADLKLSLRSD